MNPNNKFNHIASVYWVFTQLCNDKCDHCYNFSGPQGSRISEADCLAIIDNLPDSMDRIILSGGEPLAEKQKLYLILDALKSKYGNTTQIMLQTNGDLLTGEILDVLIAKGVTRFDVASIDRFHKAAGARLTELAELFDSRGVNGEEKDPLVKKDNYLHAFPLSWGYWGATEDMWLGGQLGKRQGLRKRPLEARSSAQFLWYFVRSYRFFERWTGYSPGGVHSALGGQSLLPRHKRTDGRCAHAKSGGHSGQGSRPSCISGTGQGGSLGYGRGFGYQ